MKLTREEIGLITNLPILNMEATDISKTPRGIQGVLVIDAEATVSTSKHVELVTAYTTKDEEGNVIRDDKGQVVISDPEGFNSALQTLVMEEVELELDNNTLKDYIESNKFRLDGRQFRVLLSLYNKI